MRIEPSYYRQEAPLVAQWLKKFICQCKRWGFDPWVWKIPWSRKWHPTPVFLPGKSHGQRSLVGYSPWGHKRVGHNLVTKTIQQHMDANWSEGLNCGILLGRNTFVLSILEASRM